MAYDQLIDIVISTIIDEFSQYQYVQVTETKTRDKLIRLSNGFDVLYITLFINNNPNNNFLYMDISLEELNDYIRGIVKINMIKSHILIKFCTKYKNINRYYILN
mgnify:CR=1 FL=1